MKYFNFFFKNPWLGIILPSVVLSSVLFIFKPIIFGSSYISTSGNTGSLEFILNGNFKYSTLNFNQKIIVTAYIQHNSADISDKAKNFSEEPGSALKIENLHVSNNPSDLKVKILYRALMPIEVNRVTVDGLEVDLKKFYKHNVTTKDKVYVDNLYMRKFISDLLLKYNDPITNPIIVFGTICLIPMFLELLNKIRVLRFSPKNNFKAKLLKKYNLSDDSKLNIIHHAKHEYGQQFVRIENWLQFFQVFGPGVGFAITVSSLIAGLHPALRETQDINRFYESIQVAMVSTLIGLSIRILALSLQKCNGLLFIQSDEIFFDLEKEVPKEEVSH